MLAACFVVLIVVNIAFTSDRSLVPRLPDFLSAALILGTGWLVGRPGLDIRWVPWIVAFASLLLVELMLVQTWWDTSNLGIQYALVIMVVYGQFVLSMRAMIAAAMPMLLTYGLVAYGADASTAGDVVVLALTALAVGAVTLGLRLRGIDSQSDSMNVAEALATHDPMTGLLNRRALNDKARQLVADATSRDEDVVALFLDIDRMKAVNDAHGHAMGDRVLVLVAGALQAHARSHDLIARWGGDEFVVLGAGPRLDIAALEARFCAAISQAATTLDSWDGEVSIGVAADRADGLEWEKLIDRADQDMYEHRQAERARPRSTGGDGD